MSGEFIAATVSMLVSHNKATNLSTYHDFIKKVAVQNVHMIVFPEASLQGFLFGLNQEFDADEFKYHWENAETVPGPSTIQIEKWARNFEICIVFGMLERDDTVEPPCLYNTAVLIGPNGYIGKYRKVHQPKDEQIYYKSGDSWPVFDTQFGRVGLMICYDQNFPEAARELTLAGAQLLIVPSAWAEIDDNSVNRYELFGRVRAAENNCWFIQSNQISTRNESHPHYIGFSRIVDPDGNIVAQTPEDEAGIAIAKVSLVDLNPTNKHTHWYLRHRKPSTYKKITQSPYHPNEDTANERNR